MTRTLAAIFAAVVFTGSTIAAQAQVAFDWGGDTFSDSGKQTVRLNLPGNPGDIIVSFSDRRLYFLTGPGVADSYPIAIPREQSRWEGVTNVSQKRENPAWTPTPTMLSENPRLPRWVPGGHPMNPLGNRALYLGSSAYRIHGTDAPWTIGTAASKGCVRLFNKDVADLYPRVKIGAKVTVTWKAFGGGKGNEVATKPASDGAEKSSGASQASSGSQSFAATSFFGYEEASSVGGDDAEPKSQPKKRAVEKRGSKQTADKSKAEPVKKTDAVSSGASDAAVEAEKPSKRAARPAERTRRPSIETGSVEAKVVTSAEKSGAPVTADSKVVAPHAKPAAEDVASIAARAEAAANRAAEAAERAAAAAEKTARRVQSQVE